MDPASFFAVIPRKIMISQILMVSAEHNSLQHIEHWIMLTGGCAPLLPEDWCLGGMERVGSELVSCWVRIIQCGVNISSAVDGFNWGGEQ